MSKKKTAIIMVSMVALVICVLGGLIYSSKKVEAQEKKAQQILFAKIAKQQDQEEAALQSKADAATVRVEPARMQAKALTLTTKIVSQKVGTATTKLSNLDIQRLQKYKQYSSADGKSTSENYISFQNMYLNERGNCDVLMKKFSALTLSDYSKSKVEWLTNSKLVYCSAIDQFCVRGVLSLTYYGENNFKLTPNIKYERDVEYRLVNSLSNGNVSLKLESIHYLSDFKAVK